MEKISDIYEALKKILKFFHMLESYEELDPITSYFQLPAVYMDSFGHLENQEPCGRFPYLMITNNEDSKMILFVSDTSKNTSQDSSRGTYGMFCINKQTIYIYTNHQKKVWFSYEEFKGYTGLQMLSIAKKFSEGIVETGLIVGDNSIAKTIIESIRKESKV